MTQLTIDQAMLVALRNFQAGRVQQAEDLYRQIIGYVPDHPQAWNNLGIILREQGRLDEAIEAFTRSLSIQPNAPNSLANLGNALGELGQFDQAISIYRQALALAPDAASVHHRLGLRLLLKDFNPEAWQEHEWRCQITDPQPVCRSFPQPRWTGDSLSDRTILLHAEQGIGDTLQFCRYAPLVAKRGGKITLMCQPELIRLLGGLKGVERLIGLNDSPGPFDVHCPLMSLPMLFGTTLQNIPSEVPYLKADPGPFKDLLSQEKRPKVGLAWAGRKEHLDDRNRSIDPKLLMPLLEKKEICFVSLQKEDSQSLPGLIDWTKELNDFADTASLIQNLDLIITVDTAVAHLAGALGKTTWVLLPHVPDWRWLLEREDSPWYPTLRLIRQKALGDWADPIHRLVDALKQL